MDRRRIDWRYGVDARRGVSRSAAAPAGSPPQSRAAPARRRSTGRARRRDRPQRPRADAQFGTPDLDVREGTARKLQFLGPACVLDAYLYPPRARRRSGRHPCRRPPARRPRHGPRLLRRRAQPRGKRRAEPRQRPARRLGHHRVLIADQRSAAPAISSGRPLLPAAIAALRTIRSRPIRLIGEPANTLRKPASSSASRSASARRGQLGARQEGAVGARRRRRTCSTGRPPGNRRSRRCGCRSPRGIPPGSAPYARSSGRRCSAAHRAGRAPGRRRSGRRRGRRVQLPQRIASCGASGASVERGVDRAEEQPAAVLAADQIGVLALPAEPGRLGRAAFPSPARCRRTP